MHISKSPFFALLTLVLSGACIPGVTAGDAVPQSVNRDFTAQAVRYYAPDQPVLANPWITVPASQGFKGTQNEFILQQYPALQMLAPGLQAAGLRGIKRTLPPFLEKAPDGTPNPVWVAFQGAFRNFALPKEKYPSLTLLADLYFHAQSPFAKAPPEVRAELRKMLIDGMRGHIDLDAPNFLRDVGGEYTFGNILRPYLLFEIFEPETFTPQEKREINRMIQANFYGYNGQLSALLKYPGMSMSGGNYNHDAFGFNNALAWSSIVEVQRQRYTGENDLWPGFPADLHETIKSLVVQCVRNVWNSYQGDGAIRYSAGCGHAYYYEGPQFEQQTVLWTQTYDENDPEMMEANADALQQIIAKGNYFEQVAFRIVEKDPAAHHTVSRTQFSGGKSFGNEIANRISDDDILWAMANISGNHWMRSSGPAVRMQNAFAKGNLALISGRVLGMMLPLWNPKVVIAPEPGAGFRTPHLYYDRNNMGATGRFGDWGFHMVSRNQVGRKVSPQDRPAGLFEMNTHIGFMARNSNGKPNENGLRTDHKIVSLYYVGIYPERRIFSALIAKKTGGGKGGTLGFTPHYTSVLGASTVTDSFAVQSTTSTVEAPTLTSQELWLATPNGAVGLMQSEVDENPAGGDGQARLAFYTHGYFGTKIRNHKVKDGFEVLPMSDPKTFPVIGEDQTSFSYNNLRVRVLENNFPKEKIFGEIREPGDMMPLDRASPEMAGLEELDYANNDYHGGATREIQSRGKFAAGTKPFALVTVQTGNADGPLTASTVSPSPKASHPYLAFQASEGGAAGERKFYVLFNPSDKPLDLRGIATFAGNQPVRAFRSGARYRADFLGNIEVDPEFNMQDEASFGPAAQHPKIQPLGEACQLLLPPHNHVVLVSAEQPMPKTGGPGLDVRAPLALWNFNPENQTGSGGLLQHADLVGLSPALTGAAAGETASLDGRQALQGATPATTNLLPIAGTVRAWVKPAPGLSAADVLLWQAGDPGTGQTLSLVLREIGNPATGHLLAQVSRGGELVASRWFEAKFSPGSWHQIAFRYGSTTDATTWSLFMNNIATKSVADSSPLVFQAGAAGSLVVGRGLVGELDNLAVYPAVLTPAELLFASDREAPPGFNRVALRTGPDAAVWLNGNLLVNSDKTGLDTSAIARFLRPGKNVLALELRSKAVPTIESFVSINGRDLTADLPAYSAAWKSRDGSVNEAQSSIISGYRANAEIQRAYMARTAASGTPKIVNKVDAYSPMYDRPWILPLEARGPAWGPVSWSKPQESSSEFVSAPSALTGELKWLRFEFDIDESGQAKLK